MNDHLFFCAIDKKLIPQHEEKTRVKPLRMKYKSIYTVNRRFHRDIPDKFTRNNGELIIIMRRSSTSVRTTCIVKDDANSLQSELQSKMTEHRLLKRISEAAYFGAVRCFKFLLTNKAPIDQNVFNAACISGNEEIIQMILETKELVSNMCFIYAAENWNNKLADWFITECNVQISLPEVLFPANISLFLRLLDNGADVNSRDIVIEQ